MTAIERKRALQREYDAQYAAAHPERRRQQNREKAARYQAAHPEKARARQRQYRQKFTSNCENFFKKRAIRLGSIKLAPGLEDIWRNQHGMCALSGRLLDRTNVHLDHMVPSARGGKDDISNLRWLHADVNLAKRALYDAEFIQLCREVVAVADDQLHQQAHADVYEADGICDEAPADVYEADGIYDEADEAA